MHNLLILLTALTTQTNTVDENLSAKQLITSALAGYSLKAADHLLVTISSTLPANTPMALPRKTTATDSTQITVPFDSINFHNQSGHFKLEDMLNDIDLQVIRIAKSSNTAPEHKCGKLDPESQITISLSNCEIGTLTHTYQCTLEDNKSRWINTDTDKSTISFAHKCIASAQ